MKQLDHQIEIGDYQFSYVHELEVESTWASLTDMATIRIPGRLAFNGQEVASPRGVWKKGDAVSIKAGYDGNLQTLFTGYVAGVSPGPILQIECEDEMWLLKQTDITASYKSASLNDILNEHCPIPFVAADARLGQVRISRQSLAQVLSRLRSDFGIYSWVRDGVLYSGLAYQGEGNTVEFRHGYNIIESSLEYQRGDDIAIQINAISLDNDNVKREATVGDASGQSVQMYFYDLSQADLQAAAERELERYKYEGYRGDFRAFGEPFARHGDVAEVSDNEYPDRAGSYLVKRVVYTSGVSGFRQRIELDTRVA